ncbi:MAG: alpha/beta fold hydrolase [Promethearchaeota archaeon]|jgi:pimeloyl-ACP methyl ester carboxylesterase
MPFFERENVKIYYEDVGSGEPIIANHGLGEDTTYWSETGVTAKLAEKYRVISMDMRAHGRTIIEGEPTGLDADTMGNDFGALADHLGIDKFHMLTHATGGMAGVRYAMSNSERLISLMLTDTGSATRPDFYLQPDRPQPTEEQIKAIQEWALNASIEERIQAAKANPGEFLFKMAEHPNNEDMWKIVEGFMRRQNQRSIMHFRSVFYTDPDHRVEGLRQIKCPTLILLGEFDIVFLKPSEIMAKEIPDAKHVIMPGIGHMTAIEAPEQTAKELLDFLETVKQTGKANR